MRLHALWHLLYDRLAWLFGPVAHCVSGGNWQAWGRTSLDYLTPGRVLELAHGPGHLLLALARAGYRPVGLDRSAPMGRQAARRLRRAGLAVPLVRAEAQALPFRSGSFDEVVATFPTDYIFDPETLREVARVTSGRGRLVIVVGAQPDGGPPNSHFVGWLSQRIGQDGAGRNGEASAFERAGLTARIERRSVGEGTVFLVVAERLPDELAAIRRELEADLRELSRLGSALTPTGR
jgi:ubiquinone/menaquinone biosynthesis C-methylase UbiE